MRIQTKMKCFKNVIHTATVLSFILFADTFYGQNLNPDSLRKGKLYISLNLRAAGENDPIKKRNTTYIVLIEETGVWLTQKILAGVSLSTSFLFNNYAYRKNYTPFECNGFIKTFPFQRKHTKWIGLQGQAGFANTSLETFDPKEKIFFSAALGPTFNFPLGKSGFGINFTMLVYYQNSKYFKPNFYIFGSHINLRQYLGVSYTFKR